VHERPASYMATEAVRRSLGSVPMSTVQLVLTERHCSVDVQVRLHYAVTEESTGSARPTPNRIDRFPTYPSSRSCWNDWLASSFWGTARQRSASRPSSAHRGHHSTETAILKVLSDILSALGTGNVAMLTRTARPVGGI